MLGIIGFGIAGGALAVSYVSGYWTKKLMCKDTTSLIAAGNIPDFFESKSREAFTNKVTKLIQHLEQRESLYPWQRYWTPDDKTPYLELAAQVDFLKAWLMGRSNKVLDKNSYKRAKTHARTLICSQLFENQRLVDSLNEDKLPSTTTVSTLCHRIHRFQPDIADKIQNILAMQGPNRYVYDDLEEAERDIGETLATIGTGIIQKRDANCAWKWVWWIYQPTDGTQCEEKLEKMVARVSKMWAHLTFPKDAYNGRSRDIEFEKASRRAAELGRKILNKIEDTEFQNYYPAAYRKAQFALGPIRAGLQNGLEQEIREFRDFDTKKAQQALENNYKLADAFNQLF